MNLKAIRKTKGYTQEEIANVLGIPKRTYQNYEREIHNPDISLICRLADIYEVTTDTLIGSSFAQPIGDEAVLFEKFRSLDAKSKAILIEIADVLLKERN